MNPSAYVNVNFWNVKWPSTSLPSKISKNVRCAFLLNEDGSLFERSDLKDILKSWLHDEFNECPIDFDFIVEP